MNIKLKTMCNNRQNPFLTNKYNTPYNTFPFNDIKIEDYEPAIEKGIEEEIIQINKIVNNTEPASFENTILALDKSGEILEKVSTVLGNLLNAEATEELQNLAQLMIPKLAKHSNNIYLNEKLFKRIKDVKDSIQRQKLNDEQKMLINKYYKNFVRNGASLSNDKKKTYRVCSEKLSILSLKFEQNNLKDKNSYELQITKKTDLVGLPEGLINLASEKAKDKGKAGWLFTLDAPCYIPFMKYSAKRDLRKNMYMAYNTISFKGNNYDNQNIVKQIVNTRLNLANTLGFKSYADYILNNRMAENRHNVYRLLNNLKEKYMPIAEKEIAEVSSLAKELDNIEKLMPWDWQYYSEILKKQKYNYDEEKSRVYFKLENVITGVFNLATKLYGIKFKENNSIPKYHKDIKVYEVFDKNGDFLSILYTDFFPRSTKQSGAWMTEFKSQYIDNGINIRPHVSLVMNFNPPTSDKPSLLTHSELNTFLHEFGHALHGMLSNVTYKGLSGTNVLRDFVELPSQIMENYSVESEFLNTFAKHFKSGENMPESEISKIKDSENFNIGYSCIRQLSFGFLDMAWHSITEEFNDNIETYEKKSFNGLTMMPQIAGTCMSTQFGHIFSGGYASGYYGYKWAEVLDADAFSVFKENGIFNKDTAKSFRENILSKGGSQPPMQLYIKFRGKKPTIEALLKRNGIN